MAIKLSPLSVRYKPWNEYRCKSEVIAAEITSIQKHTHGAKAQLQGDEPNWFHLGQEFIRQHNPLVGGYLVRYDDWHLTYVPRVKFQREYQPA